MKEALRKTNIVCTIGPAVENRLEELIKNGMSVARINFSHGDYAEQKEKIERFFRIRKELGLPASIMLDTKGPEVRTGINAAGRDAAVTLKEGQKYTLFHDDRPGDEEGTTVTYKDLYKDVAPGNMILINDGKVQIKVDEIKGQDIVCTVVVGGKLTSRKGINVPGVSIKMPFLSPKDINDLTNGAKAGFDYVSASFVRNKQDVLDMRKLLDENGGERVKILPKIECQEGIDNFEEILSVSDGIMVARGDMAVEVPFEIVPIVQKYIIKRCNEEGKLVITATQMLDSMTTNPVPTRAEVSDVANAVYDRTSCIMLSGESAMGDYPMECVDAMVRISKAVENDIHYWKRFSKKDWKLDEKDVEENACYSTCVTAKDINADAIIDYTHTGKSATRLAGFGPACPIFAITDCEKTYNQLAPVWNVYPVLVKDEKDRDAIINKGIEKLLADGRLEKGDTAVLCGGPQIVNDDPHYAVNKTLGGIIKL